MNTRKILSLMVMAGMLVVAFLMAPLRAAAPVEDKASIAARVVHEVANKYGIQEMLDFEFTTFGEDAHSSGSAEMEWGPNVCRIRLDPAKAELFWSKVGTFEQSLMFVALHEMAHCLYYKHQQLDWKKAGYHGNVTDQALNEYLLSDAVTESQERVNFLSIAHEAYADAFAIQVLRQRGVSWQELDRIRELREQAVNDRVHATGKIYHLLNNPRYDGRDALDAAREVTAKFMMQSPSFSFVVEHMTQENIQGFIVDGWCSWAQYLTAYPAYHPMLGKVHDTKAFYPDFVMPQFIKSRFDAKGYDWQGRCNEDARVALN